MDKQCGGKGIFTILFHWVFWLCHMVCGISIPWPGIEPLPSAVKWQSPNHWNPGIPARNPSLFYVISESALKQIML